MAKPTILGVVLDHVRQSPTWCHVCEAALETNETCGFYYEGLVRRDICLRCLQAGADEIVLKLTKRAQRYEELAALDRLDACHQWILPDTNNFPVGRDHDLIGVIDALARIGLTLDLVDEYAVDAIRCHLRRADPQ